MQFSIRSLLAISLLFGLAFPVYTKLQQLREQEAALVELQNEAEAFRQRNLASGDARWADLAEHEADEYESVARLRNIAVERFAELQAKYGEVENRGEEVLSIRPIPQLSLDRSSAPTAFRIIVPTTRPLWLKCAVVPQAYRYGGAAKLDEFVETMAGPLADTKFTDIGPFTTKLRPGVQVLKVPFGQQDSGSLPISVLLDEKLLFETRFEDRGTISTGGSSLGGYTQVDYKPKNQLPRLIQRRMTTRTPDGVRVESTYVFAVWLSDNPGLEEAEPSP